ncbi:hypothetical protein WDU94_003307 [Cyamophila willieti]
MDSLVADYGSESEQSDNSDSSDSETPPVVKEKDMPESQPKKPTLPPPSFDDNSGSIFINPYIEAENAKSAILEKHVKMIPSKEFISEINGKKLCWMYKKGRCRFGSNCKYAHDSELYNQEQSKSEEKLSDGPTTPCNTENQPTPSKPPGLKSYFPPHQPLQQEFHQKSFPGEDNDDTGRPLQKKKRPGLSQTIVPGKKVMKMYYSSSKQGT